MGEVEAQAVEAESAPSVEAASATAQAAEPQILALEDCEKAVRDTNAAADPEAVRRRAVELRGHVLGSRLWPKLLRRAGADRLRQFGIPDLLFRLACQAERERRAGIPPDPQERAAVWCHVAEQYSEGKSEIPDLTEASLRAWTPGGEAAPRTVSARCLICGKRMRQVRGSKFASCLACRRAAKAGKAAAAEEKRTGELPEGFKACGRCGKPFECRRADAKYCAPCRKAAGREARRACYRRAKEAAKAENRALAA